MKFSLWPCWQPDSPALEKHSAQSCVTECHDPKIFAFSPPLTGEFEIPGLKVLWDYISEGFCDDGSWQVLLSSGWRNSVQCLHCTEPERTASVKHTVCGMNHISTFSYWICWLIKSKFILLYCFQTVFNKIYDHMTFSITVKTRCVLPSLK